MADKVNTDVVFDGTRHHIIHITNESDGTGEVDVVKVDLSTLSLLGGIAPTKTSIIEIEYSIAGFNFINLSWDHTVDDVIAVLKGQGFLDFTRDGGLVDPATTGGTGNIVLTTDGAVASASYDIRIKVRLKA